LLQTKVAGAPAAASFSVTVKPYVPGSFNTPETEVAVPVNAVSAMPEVPAGDVARLHEYGGTPPDPVSGSVKVAGAINAVGQDPPALMLSGGGGGEFTTSVHD